VAVVGSLNIDRTFSVPTLPAPGETVLANTAFAGLGGKGTNQAVAAARCGAATALIACVGPDSTRWTDMVDAEGIDTTWLTRTADTATGSAVIAVDEAGENSIIVDLGANQRLDAASVTASIEALAPRVVLSQLEVPIEAMAAGLASEGPITIVNAAPFDHAIVRHLDRIDVLIVNESEHAMLRDSDADTGVVDTLVITRGANGLDVITSGNEPHHVEPSRVHPVDTTGAGDTFCGYLAARLAAGDALLTACELASRAAALATTRHGATASIPRLSDL
jgi:ribokinase